MTYCGTHCFRQVIRWPIGCFSIKKLLQIRIAVLLVALATVTLACVHTAVEDQNVLAAVDEITTAPIESGGIQGVAVVIARNGSIIHDRGYGLAHIENNVAMTSRSMHDYFSIGKHMTAAILLRLAERGKVDLDIPATLYLPEADFEEADVTVRQLLTHTSGLWEAEKDENDLPSRYADPPPEGAVLDWANQGERLAGPGETWMYSNGGYMFAGKVAERVSGKALEELLVEELASPLGLEGFAGCKDLDAVLASEYTYTDGEVRPIADVDAGWWGGSGNACGTAGDLMRWWLALRSGRVLSALSLEQMFSPTRLRREAVQADFGYGLGIRVGEFWGNTKVGHTGSGSGGTAVLAEYPESELAIVVIVNTAGDEVASAADIEAEIAATLLELDTSMPERRPIPDDVLTSAPGKYRSPYQEFCVSARGAELWRSIDDSDPEHLYHVGGGQFVSVHGDSGLSVEYFLGTETGRAHWFGYDYNGFPQDLAIRTDDECR